MELRVRDLAPRNILAPVSRLFTSEQKHQIILKQLQILTSIGHFLHVVFPMTSAPDMFRPRFVDNQRRALRAGTQPPF